MIKIENLRKCFGKEVVALDNLTLEFEESMFIALLGPSGCGKTTTLNCIAGLLEPTDGKIFFDNKDVTDLQPKDRNIGMVFQSYALYPHMRVIDNIAFCLKQKGLKKEDRHNKAREIAKKLQIEHLLNRKPSELSGGQQQRVSMARALIKNPRVLLFDEPMSNLDARLKIEIRDEIKRIQQDSGITAILVTHDQEEAMAMADKIAILDNGQIQQFDTPEELYHHPKNLFVAHFMGNPPMNFINGKIGKVKNAIVIEGKSYSLAVPSNISKTFEDLINQKVVIGVRSHQITVCFDKEEGCIPLKLQAVENLGKELMVTGYIDEDFVRVSISNNIQDMQLQLNSLKKEMLPMVYIKLFNYNIFSEKTGLNLTV